MSAQLAFYDRFFLLTFKSAYAIVGKNQEAEEIMQDTFMKVFTKKDNLHDDPEVMKRILRRIATNAAIDVIRKRKDFVISIDEAYVADQEDENEELTPDTLSISEIQNGISKLSSIYRSIICLRLFEEMSFSEIADKLMLNPSTVRVQYTRGISKLKTILKQSVDL